MERPFFALLVKGSAGQAMHACSARGLRDCALVREILAPGRDVETVLHAPAVNRVPVVRWFCEPPHDAPFAPGTLLLYTEFADCEPEIFERAGR